MALSNAKSGRDVDPTLRPDSRLAFRRPGRPTHGTHRMQGIIFADDVRSCTTCQQAKAPTHARFGLLNPIQVLYAAWASTSVDFIIQLPKSAGYTQIMVVVDRFMKMAHFIGLQENATAKDVAEAFLKEVWKLHGLPSEIILDMDAKFAGEFWESLCKLLGIKRKMSTAYHPQTDR